MSILLLKNKLKWPLNTILVREWKDDDIDFFEFNGISYIDDNEIILHKKYWRIYSEDYTCELLSNGGDNAFIYNDNHGLKYSAQKATPKQIKYLKSKIRKYND